MAERGLFCLSRKNFADGETKGAVFVLRGVKRALREEGIPIGEEELLRLLRRGDPAGLEELMERYTAYVCAVAARILPGRPEEWEELAAETFLEAWNRRRTLRPGNLKGWLGTVVRNRAFNRLRAGRETLPLEEDALLLSPDSPQAELERRELEQVLRRALDSLEEGDRELFVRHYYYGQTVARAAEEMGLNLSTAKTRLRRGRERLKEFLREVGYEFEET